MPHLFNPLYNAVSWVLLRFHNLLSLVFPSGSGAAWGLAIVGLVVLIRIALIPLFVKQIKAQRGLQALQPQMTELRKKYGNDRQKLSEETMKLYKETGTNPLSSCLPVFVQMPFFFALFHVLNYVSHGRQVGVLSKADVASFHHAKVFGAPIYETFVKATSVHTKVVAIAFIVLMSASQFITQRQLMVKNMPIGQDNPMAQQQRLMLYGYPVVFAVFGINFPIGTLIYWLTTNVWTMGQQFYVIRRNPTPGSAAYLELQARRKAALQPAAALTEAAPADEPAPPKRQQPKRQTRSQRRAPAKAGPKAGEPASSGPADVAGDPDGDSPEGESPDGESKEAS
ncbi:MAG TPA: membrane protein insertase YidC [Actinomycetes bacterium]|nr:membrane protein insertase YidC [Actinomycetes bacterium]